MFESLARPAALLLLFIATLTAAPAARAQVRPGRIAPGDPTVVIVVRHAEKADVPADDPPLTDAGQRRAEKLAMIGEAAGVDVVFTTQFLRTRATARPLIRRLGIPSHVRDVTPTTVNAHVADLAREIRSAHRGKTVLVVGHSNTAPRVAGALSGRSIRDLNDANEFDAIFVVTIPQSGTPTLTRSKY